jgi:hypothetical protein
MTEPTPDPDDGHADTVDEDDYVDPDQFDDFSDVDSTTVDSGEGAPS